MKDVKTKQNKDIKKSETSVEENDKNFNPYLGEIIDKSTRSNHQMMGHC